MSFRTVLGRAHPSGWVGLRAAAGRRERLIERSELEWLGDARPPGTVEEAAHLVVYQVTRREDHALGVGRVVAAQPLEELLAGKVRHAHVDNHGIVFRCLEANEGVLAARGRLDVVAFAGEIPL